MSRLRVLIADDHPIVRRGVRGILEDASDVGELGEAETPQQVLDLVRARPWDVLLLDLGLPGRGGLEVLKDVRQEYPKLPVLILSMQPESQYAIRALRAGASGYLTKESAPEKLLVAIRKVHAGGRYVSAALAEQLAAEIGVDADTPPHSRLSDREFEVMRMLAAGRSVSQVAEQLSLSVKTISTYRARVLEKMGLATNADLTQYALRNHLIE
jgi:two-component system, NarL family, invasion response regulator UvrY